MIFLPSSLSAAEEDAGDAEQDAAADARQGLVMFPAAELKLRRHLLFLPPATVRPSALDGGNS